MKGLSKGKIKLQATVSGVNAQMRYRMPAKSRIKGTVELEYSAVLLETREGRPGMGLGRGARGA